MALDPSILLGYRPPQVMDPMERQQKALTLKSLRDQETMNQWKMQDYQKARSEEEAMRGIIQQSGGDLKRARDMLLEGGYLDKAQAIDKHLAEQGKNTAEIDSKTVETAKKKLDLFGQVAGAVMQDPTVDNAYGGLRQLISFGVLTPEKAAELASQIPTTPEGIKAWATRGYQSALATKDQLPKLDKIDLGGSVQAVSINPITGKPTVTGSFDKTMTPDQIADNNLNAANSPFNADGTPNTRVQSYEVTKAKSGATNVNVNPNDVTLGKTGQGKVDEKLIDDTSRLSRLSAIQSTFKPEYTKIGDRTRMAFNAGKLKLGGKLDATEEKQLREFSEWKRNAITNLNQTIKDLTGAAMGVQEADRIIASLPNPGEGITDGDDAVSFKSKLDGAIRDVKYAIARGAYIKRNGGNMSIADIPLDRMPALMNERGQSIERELLAATPALKNDQKALKRQVRDRIAVEFGLVGQ